MGVKGNFKVLLIILQILNSGVKENFSRYEYPYFLAKNKCIHAIPLCDNEYECDFYNDCDIDCDNAS